MQEHYNSNRKGMQLFYPKDEGIVSRETVIYKRFSKPKQSVSRETTDKNTRSCRYKKRTIQDKKIEK